MTSDLSPRSLLGAAAIVALGVLLAGACSTTRSLPPQTRSTTQAASAPSTLGPVASRGAMVARWSLLPTLAARSGASAAWDSAAGGLVLFGGQSFEALGDGWRWDGSRWAPLQSLASPGDRVDAAFAMHGGEGVLFGGQSRYGAALQDTWLLDATGWTQRSMRASPAAQAPSGLVWGGDALGFVLVGRGSLPEEPLALFRFGGDTWQPIAVSGPAPRRREGAAVQHVPGRGIVVLGGICADGSFCNDTWLFDGTRWQELSAAPGFTAPPPRNGGRLAYDATRRELVLFGGCLSGTGGCSSPTSDTWALADDGWIERHPRTVPPPRASHVLVHDDRKGRVIAFGGVDAGGPISDLWAWDGTDWFQETPGAGITARVDSTMAYDEALEGLVVFGIPALGSVNDTWLLRGDSWTKLAPLPEGAPILYSPHLASLGPRGGVLLHGETGDHWTLHDGTWTRVEGDDQPATGYAAMAHDRRHDRVLLFGGNVGWSGPGDDTWAFDGAAWTKLAPLHRPDARSEAQMVYDEARDEVLLFGGAGPNGTLAPNDTWVFKDGDWSRRFPTSPPQARRGTGLVYDPPRQRVILFSGAGLGTNPLDDTWEWDGSAWTPIFPEARPPAMAQHSMGYDRAGRRVVAFSGRRTFSGASTETWVYGVRGNACGGDGECDTGHCVDGVCCVASSCGVCETCAATTAPGLCSTRPSADDEDTCHGSRSCDPAGACKGKLGAACNGESDCLSGFCVDRVCCDTACNGTCAACSAGAKASGKDDGLCGPAKEGTDPRESCAPDPAQPCGRTGVCNGAGACAVGAPGARCGALGETTCDGRLVRGRTCDGFGLCRVTQTATDCTPGRCDDGGCVLTCAGNDDCAPTAFCNEGLCTPRKPRGDACRGADDCEGNLCVDGVCCNAPCQGQCEACNVEGAIGAAQEFASTVAALHHGQPTA